MLHYKKTAAIFLATTVLSFSAPRVFADCPSNPDPNDDAPTPETQPLAQEKEQDLTAIDEAVAQTYNVPRSDACVQDKNDPYDPGVKFAAGKFTGKCMDSSSERIPVITREDDGSIEIANFYHEGKYWIAKIPKDGVRDVAFQITPFDLAGLRGNVAMDVDPLSQAIHIAHTQYRVFMKPGSPIELTSQDNGETQKTTLPDLEISTTYSAPKGVGYSPFTGNHAYGIITRALSVQARAGEQIAKDRNTPAQYILKYTQDEKNAFIVQALHDAANIKYTDVYNLEKKSCTTEAFNMNDEVHPRPEGVMPFHWNWWRLHDEVIQPSLDALKARHLIDKHSKIEPMTGDVVCKKLANTKVDHTLACTEKGVPLTSGTPAATETRGDSAAPQPEAVPGSDDPAKTASPDGAQ